MTRPPNLRAVEPDQVAEALAEALAGGAPIAPLPTDPIARPVTWAMLQPDQPVLEPDAVAIVATSGSTGAPKGVVLSRAAVRASAAATEQRLGGPGDWALALPPHYVAGLMVLARAHLDGRRALPVRSDLADLAAVADRLQAPRYISVVPTQLVRALADPELTRALGRFDAVLVGGGPLDPEQRGRAESDRIRVVETYGMSETCGGCFYDGAPLEAVTTQIDDHERIMIGGPTLFSGYRLQPELTAETLDHGWLRTPDRGRWADGRLAVLGRVDDVMITGGLKVDRTEVERWVGRWAHANGGDAVVLGIADQEWGTTIIAVTDASGPLPDLQAYVRQHLPAYAAPRSLVHVELLPRLASGKPDRLAIRTLVEGRR